MWRTHKAHRLIKEKEADERMMRSKEISSIYQEPTISFLQVRKIQINVSKQVPFILYMLWNIKVLSKYKVLPYQISSLPDP